MSQKVWGYDTKAKKYVHVVDVSKKTHKGVITCPECGKELVICQGEHRDWYFRHKDENTKCTGGGVETLLHKLAKQFIGSLEEGSQFYVPEYRVNYKGTEISVLPEDTDDVEVVDVEPRLYGGKLRPDCVVYDSSMESITCVEIKVHHGVDATKLDNYRKFAKQQLHDYNVSVNVVEIDLSSFLDDFDTHLSKEIKSALKDNLSVNGKPIKRTIFSTLPYNLMNYEFNFQDGYVVCPMTSEPEWIMNTKKCKKCPFFISHSKNQNKCYGFGGIGSAGDAVKALRFGLDKEMQLDIYSGSMPAPAYTVDKYAGISMLGKCSCGGDMIIGQANAPGVMSIKGIPIWNYLSDAGAYQICTKCGKVRKIKCPDCGSDMKILRSVKHGKIFLICDKNDSDGDDICKCSLTLFMREPCDNNYADEIICVGGLDNFLSGRPKYKKALEKLRAANRINKV